MYIKYWSLGYVGHYLVKDVHFFGIKEAGEDENGINLYAICDMSIDDLKKYCNDVILSLATHILDGDEKIFQGSNYRKGILPVNENGEWDKELAYFTSPDAAAKVLNDICAAMDAGKQFFDLTVYDENGNKEG